MMKKLLFAVLLAVLLPVQALAALNASAVWELRTAGNDTNGGGFRINVATKSTPTDLVIDASDSTKVSSTAYGFTSADVGRYLQPTAGTGFNLAYYRITAVSSGVATLDASVGTVGSTGGTAQIYWGLDYSQQNAKNTNGGTNGSSVLGVTAGTTAIVCSDCQFTSDLDGNTIYISGGTGSVTAQRYEVQSVTNATTIVVDRTTGLTAGTGVTINIGGALATWDELFSARAAISGNKVFVKADGTYTTSAGYNTALNPISFIGYTSSRTDGGQATLQSSATAAYVFKSTGTSRLFNLIFDCNSVSGCGGVDINAGSGILYNVTAMNYDGIGILEEVNTICDNCEAKGGTSNATAGIKLTSTSSSAINSYVHDGQGPGIVSSVVSPIVGSLIANQSGATADGIQCSGSCVLLNNTVYNSGRHGINNTNTSITVPVFHGNLLVNNAGWGILTAASSALPPWPNTDGNAYYNNTLGNRTLNITDRTLRGNAVYPYVLQYQRILTGDPFVNAAGGNFALNSTAGAGLSAQGTGIPQGWRGTSTINYPDMGAVHHNVNTVPNFGF